MGKYKVNAYLMYMHEQRKVIPGWQNKTNQELMVMCDKGWKSMSKEERSRYSGNMREEQDSTREKGEVRIHGGYDALGRPLDQNKRRDAERVKKDEDKRIWIEEMVINAREQGILDNIKFNVMAVNIFTKTEEDPPIYVPAELSVAQFSLREGLVMENCVFHAFPSPGKIPVGYKRRCLENSELRHKVPIPGLSEDPEECYGGVKVKFVVTEDRDLCRDLTRFLSQCDLVKPTVFTMPCQMDQVQGVVSCLFQRAGRSPLPLQVLPLPSLLLQLSTSRSSVPTVFMAEAELEKERFLFRPDLDCKWHAAHTNTNHCTSAVVRRWAYVVMDLVCSDYNIDLVGGRHIPRGLETKCKEEISWSQTEERTRNIVQSNLSQTLAREKGFGAMDIRRLNNPVEPVKVQIYKDEKEPVNLNIKKPDTTTRDTISDFMGNMTVSYLSEESDSSDCDGAEFHSLASLTSASQTGDISRSVTELTGGLNPTLGRGKPVRKRGGRIIANFPMRLENNNS